MRIHNYNSQLFWWHNGISIQFLFKKEAKCSQNTDSETSNEAINSVKIEMKPDIEPNSNIDNEEIFKCISCSDEFHERYLLIKHYDTAKHQDVTIVVNVFKNQS